MLLEPGLVLLDEVEDIGLGDHRAVEAHALAKIFEVGGGVEPHGVAMSLEDAGQGVTGAALAVGAGHVDGLEGVFGVAQVVHEVPGGLQVMLVRGTAHTLVPGELCNEQLDRLGVIHRVCGWA